MGARVGTVGRGPVAVPAGGGEARWWMGSLAVIRATAAETGGAMTIVDVTDPPGAAAPLHVHHREDETFLIIEGEATVTVGEIAMEARAGDLVIGPRGVPHRYIAGPAGCRLLLICTPAGFEGLVRATSEPAARRQLPPPSAEEPDWDRIHAAALAHGCELVG